MNLKSCIDTLKFTKEPGTQLDLFRENGQVIIQIYKQRDVLTWGLEIYLDDPDGLVLEVLFNKAKKIIMKIMHDLLNQNYLNILPR